MEVRSSEGLGLTRGAHKPNAGRTWRNLCLKARSYSPAIARSAVTPAADASHAPMRLSRAVSSVPGEGWRVLLKPTTKAWAGSATTKRVAMMSSNPPSVAAPPHLAQMNGQASAATTPAMTAVSNVGRRFKALAERAGLGQ